MWIELRSSIYYDFSGNKIKLTEKTLELNKNKTVFVMEDLHWIDPESYAFLKHFIKKQKKIKN